MSLPDNSPIVVDSSILIPWSLAGKAELLVSVGDMFTTDFVYDLNEISQLDPLIITKTWGACDIAKDILHYRRQGSDPRLTDYWHRAAQTAADNLERLADHLIDNRLKIISLQEPQEIDLYARLTSQKRAEELGLVRSIGYSAASCVTVAYERDMILASDDKDAVRALKVLSHDHPSIGTQALLRRASQAGHISQQEANDIHLDIAYRGICDPNPPYR